MTESQVVNRWIEKAQNETKLADARDYLIQVLNHRFPGQVPAEILETINQQPSLTLFRAWFDEALAVPAIADFVAVLRR